MQHGVSDEQLQCEDAQLEHEEVLKHLEELQVLVEHELHVLFDEGQKQEHVNQLNHEFHDVEQLCYVKSLGHELMRLQKLEGECD